MLEAPLLLWGNFDSELLRLQPPPLEKDLDLLLAVANHWEEQHIDEVLLSSTQVSSPTINH